MMTIESSSTSPSNEAPLQGLDLSQLGPGRRLRDARKVMNLDQADIAANLNLSLGVVNALERDDYEDMPPPVFVRGYLRAYAVLVNQAEEEVCAMYDALIGNDAEDDPFRPVALKDEKVPGDKSMVVKGTAALVGVVLLVVVVMWFFAPGTFGEKPASDEASAGQGLESDAEATQPAGTEVDSQVSVLPTRREVVSDQSMADHTEQSGPDMEAQEIVAPLPSGTEEMELVTQAAASPDAPLTGQAVEPDVEVVTPAAALTVQSRTADAEVNTATNPIAESQAVVRVPDAQPQQAGQVVAAPEITEPAPSTNTVTLSLSFSDSCWTSISDATGKRLVYGVMKAGVQREVSGELPFKVILGQADAVKVLLNGQPFDHQPYSRGKIARFTINGDDG